MEMENMNGGFKSERSKIFVAFLLFLSFLITCILFNQILDGYFMWLYIFRGFIRIYWHNKPLYTIQSQFNLKYPLWIPIIPLIVALTYLIAMKQLFNSRLFLHGKRIHHYHIGLSSIGFAVTLLIALMLTSYEEPAAMWLGWKRTSITEVLQGLSFTFMIGGTTLITLDAGDLASALINRFRKHQMRK